MDTFGPWRGVELEGMLWPKCWGQTSVPLESTFDKRAFHKMLRSARVTTTRACATPDLLKRSPWCPTLRARGVRATTRMACKPRHLGATYSLFRLGLMTRFSQTVSGPFPSDRRAPRGLGTRNALPGSHTTRATSLARAMPLQQRLALSRPWTSITPLCNYPMTWGYEGVGRHWGWRKQHSGCRRHSGWRRHSKMAYMNLLYFVYLLFHVGWSQQRDTNLQLCNCGTHFIVDAFNRSPNETSGYGFHDFAERPFLNCCTVFALLFFIDFSHLCLDDYLCMFTVCFYVGSPGTLAIVLPQKLDICTTHDIVDFSFVDRFDF